MVYVSRAFKPAHSRNTRTCQCCCVVVMTPYQLMTTKHVHKYICDLRLILDVDWGSDREAPITCGWCRCNHFKTQWWCRPLWLVHTTRQLPQVHFDPPILIQTSMHIYTISSTYTQNKINGDCTVIWHVWKVCLGPAVLNPAAPQPNNSEQWRACSTSEPTSSRWSCPLVTDEWVS